MTSAPRSAPPSSACWPSTATLPTPKPTRSSVSSTRWKPSPTTGPEREGPRPGYPARAGGTVAVEDPGAVGAVGGGGTVGVQGDLPAPLVDRHVVMEETVQRAAVHAGGARRRPGGSRGAPHRPRRAGRSRRPSGSADRAGLPRAGSRPGSRRCRPTSSGSDGPASRAPSSRVRRKLASPPGPDTRSTALPMMACRSISRASAVGGRGPGGQVGHRPVSPRTAGPVLAGSAGAAVSWPTPQWGPWPTYCRHKAHQLIQGAGVDLAGDHRDDGGVAGHGAGGLAVQPGGAVAAGLGGSRAAGGPPDGHLADPLLLQHRPVVQGAQLGQG